MPECAKSKTTTRRGLRAPFVVTLSVTMACGGSTTSVDSNSERDGAAGSLSDAGIDSGGAGGTSSVCPAAADVPSYGPCSPPTSPDGCTYTFQCQGGPATLTYICAEYGWRLQDGTTCSHEGDSCIGRNMQCANGYWADYTGMGGNPPTPCPESRPAPGSSCFINIYSGGYPACGYACDDGTWTVANCTTLPTPTAGVWLFDGACQGDCSAADKALNDYATEHDQCTVDSDCSILYSGCAITRQHCSGAFYVGATADPATWQQLDQALTACSQQGSLCSWCGAEPPPPRCSESGQCVPSE